MRDGEEVHRLKEYPLRFTKKGLKELSKTGTAKIGFNPFDYLMYGAEIFHVNSEGVIRQIPINSKEGQKIYNKFNEEELQ